MAADSSSRRQGLAILLQSPGLLSLRANPVYELQGAIRCIASSVQTIETVVFVRMENNWTKQLLRLSNGHYEAMKHLLKTQKFLQ